MIEWRRVEEGEIVHVGHDDTLENLQRESVSFVRNEKRKDERLLGCEIR